MLVDTAHSMIEKRLRNRSIYLPNQYEEVFQQCGFVTKRLTNDFFTDFTDLEGFRSPERGPVTPRSWTCGPSASAPMGRKCSSRKVSMCRKTFQSCSSYSC